MKDGKALVSREALMRRFGPGEEPWVTRAPGRVNLIGEHTDYNGGYVLPFAIDRYTEVALRPRRDLLVKAYAQAFEEEFGFSLPLRNPTPSGGWADYLLGILLELAGHGELPHGFEVVIVGNVPLSAGLSSSASLEVTLALGLSRLYGIELGDLDLVQLCQRAENTFVGTSCGIMDQYVSYFAREGTALLLDTQVLRHRYVPLGLPGVAFLVIDSSVRRALSQSGYNDRRRECEEALRWLQRAFPDRGIATLSDVTEEDLEPLAREMPAHLWRRALHVVRENARVLSTVAALERGDAEEVGRLLSASHASLRDLYEVSTPELDFLVDWGLAHGALGARLVGGGFGGVTLHLVPEGEADAYVAAIRQAYRRKFGREARALKVRPGPGAKELNP